jgi:hypothetical protein
VPTARGRPSGSTPREPRGGGDRDRDRDRDPGAARSSAVCAQEKRRLQEAIGAARRELEEEKLRVQRLKVGAGAWRAGGPGCGGSWRPPIPSWEGRGGARAGMGTHVPPWEEGGDLEVFVSVFFWGG